MARKPKKTSLDAYHKALLMISPGTKIREGISAIMQAGTGALLCFGSLKKLTELSEAGVKLDAKMTPQLLYELSKMDGAILLNEDGSRVLYANRVLKPDATITSEETGTRHRAAERLARQAKCVVIAVSQRRSSVTLYVHDIRHVMGTIPTLLNKAQQAIQTLEKYTNVLKQELQELTVREFQDIVTIFDVCRAIQRMEMVSRMAAEIEPYILELGAEGRLVELQVQELLQPVEEAVLVIRDYYREKADVNFDAVRARVSEISEQDIFNLGAISQALGYGPNLRSVDTYLTPRGYRVLTGTHRLSPQIIENLVQRFGSLQQLIRAPKDELVAVDGVGEVLAERVRASLNMLHNQLVWEDRR
ncbi:MAG TPA: DNA integrity scanning diadenylate cyclase DisA [Candidatus Hydrogenedentes bacterium]|nr:DNA integrity scanning diadenylate cyclase DisA [Candidatus Hydrogenedentota bacterium]HNT87854.1 DNA integrity scanning diadenylate cyclase DisA [Candidatus Hydrogenedentota bacterium]